MGIGRRRENLSGAGAVALKRRDLAVSLAQALPQKKSTSYTSKEVPEKVTLPRKFRIVK
jgi:hypothetical protein